MAWDDFEAWGATGWAGDQSIDAMVQGLADLGSAFEKRFDRRPTVAEAVYSFVRAIQSSPEEFFADPDSVGGLHVQLDVATAVSCVPSDGERYEASYAPKPEDSHLVTRVSDGVDVLKLPLLKAAHGTLGVYFEVLVDGITDEQARSMILDSVLRDLYDHSYKQEASSIRFVNAKTKAKKKVPYP